MKGGFSLWISCSLPSSFTGHWTLVTAATPPCGGSRRRQEHFLLAYQGVSVHNARKETDNGYSQHPVLAADACCLSRSCRLLTGSLSGTGSVPRRCERPGIADRAIPWAKGFEK